jgi:hypothetical protein
MGDARYVLHFGKDEIPPAKAFWSLTMYGADQFFVANPLGRYAIGDRDKLAYNADGSLDLYIQHAWPGQDKEANWLPAPAAGPFSMNLRLYLPKWLTACRPSSRYSMSAFCTCILFSASSQTTDCGPSITSASTSSPRCAGRQCMNRASGLAAAIISASTHQSAKAFLRASFSAS